MTFDPAGGEAGKHDGMARAARGCNPAWWVFMVECVQMVARRVPYFSMDEVEAMRIARQGPSTHEHRANGPLINYAAKLGYCVATVDWVASRQKGNHARPMRVWWSLLYSGPVRFRRPHRTPLDPRQFNLFDDDEDEDAS